MDLDPQLAAAHAEIPYASSAVVTLAYREEDLAHPLDGYGYVVPRVEGSDVLACTWTSSKWEGRAPAGGVLVRVYAGRFGGRDVTEDSDGELVALARDEVRDAGIEAGRASPAFTAGRSGCRSTFSATRTGWTGSTLLSPITPVSHLPGRRIGAWAFPTASTPARWPRARSRCRSLESADDAGNLRAVLLRGARAHAWRRFLARAGVPGGRRQPGVRRAWRGRVPRRRRRQSLRRLRPLLGTARARPRASASWLRSRRGFAAARATARRARSRSSSRA